VLDLFSRRVVSWSMSGTMPQELTIAALQMAITNRRPAPGLVHHSDRGSQYAAHAYRQLLADTGMVCSMSRKGNCWDNALHGKLLWEPENREGPSSTVRNTPGCEERCICFPRRILQLNPAAFGYRMPIIC